MSYQKLLIFLVISILIFFPINGDINVKLGYCKIECSRSCTKKPDIGVKKHIEGYYWRDYHGVVPPDAFPLGPAYQYPKTYIGLVFDPSKNGTFPTTIVEGLDYVYTSENGVSMKLERNIQILCTMEPERFAWFKITKYNINTRRQGDIFVDGGSRYVFRHFKYHYIVKSTKCSIVYAGFVNGLGDKLEYAVMDGKSVETESFLWLMYRPTKGTHDKQGKNKEEPLISHIYEYAVRKGTLIPYFYRRTRIGYCTLTCENDRGTKGKIKRSMLATTSMAYYWRPGDLFKKEEAFLAGHTSDNSSLYIGQAHSYLNFVDIGQSDGHGVSIIIGDKTTLRENKYFNILCLQQPEKFQWIEANYNSFTLLDKSSLIPGGLFPNGTRSYVGRVKDGYLVAPGSIRDYHFKAYCFANYKAYGKYQVLVYKDQKKEKLRNI